MPKFLHHFVVQNWFKKLFPLFTLEVRRLWEAGKPRLGVGEGVKVGATPHAEWS